LAQSRGHRGAIESKAALRTRTILDVIYVRRRSIGLYWSVLIATALAFLFHDNAF
jgi:lipopolysaccharide/colanic/teichoic acid biosynthesis glycosyltransferase